MRRPRERWDWTRTRCGGGTAGTGTSPWPCGLTPLGRPSGIMRWHRAKKGPLRPRCSPDARDGPGGATAAHPPGMDRAPTTRFHPVRVVVETTPPSHSAAMPLPKTPIKSATVVLEPVDKLYSHRHSVMGVTMQCNHIMASTSRWGRGTATGRIRERAPPTATIRCCNESGRETGP